jgi:hypothetical protein
VHGILVWTMLMSIAVPAVAQDFLRSPYRASASGDVRGLTRQEVADLEAGRGMGLARAAELNGYPGPRHVLDAAQAGRLPLSADQARQVQQVFDGMAARAQRLGKLVLDEERDLETAFRSSQIRPPDLEARVSRIAGLNGELRAVHLEAHLATRAILTDGQVRRYNELRGYAERPPEQRHHDSQ